MLIVFRAWSIILTMANDWSPFFDSVKQKPYSKSLHAFLDEEYAHKTIYPPRRLLFNAFNLTSPKSLKAVIIGQDPYHEPGQAMGLSFSVPSGVILPPSLRNIYLEIEQDLGVKLDYSYGDLSEWAKQGVLLLNAYLSVEEGKPLSHRREEYELFIQDALDYIEMLPQPIVYLLWGGFAKRYRPSIVNPKHTAIMAVHPSPLSANRGGWFGEKVFSRCNAFLIENGSTPIDWAKGRERIELF